MLSRLTTRKWLLCLDFVLPRAGRSLAGGRRSWLGGHMENRQKCG
jgi:hypothetical protein